MLIENVQILMNDGVFRKGSIEFDETIQKIRLNEGGEAGTGPYLIPGLIDIHTHGACGGDHCDASAEKMHEMAAFYARNGVTSFLATTLTASEELIAAAMCNIAQYERQPNGARCAGINMEGPFFSYDKRGAQPAEMLLNPDITMFERLFKISKDSIKLVCIAPELPGSMEFIREVSQVCHVSLAHSTADYETAMQAFGNGATHATHLFNGMNSFLHRDPGIIGAALDADAFVELICDGNHLHPAIIRAIFKMFPRRACLISDSLRCAGLPDGEYEFVGFPITVKNGRATTGAGNLAGSTISLMQGVRRAVALGIPLAMAVTAASSHSAKAIGMEGKIGSLVPGAYSDMVLLDSELRIQKVFIEGEEINQ